MDARSTSDAVTIRAAGAMPAVAALCCLASLALFWPGYAMFDSVDQFGQALSGDYNDWHPPIMARLWALLHDSFGGGAAPMLVLQMTLYWLGLGLIAGALRRSGRWRAGPAVLLVGLVPLWLGWQAVVLKDTQMAGALLAATGLIAWWRLAGRRLPPLAFAMVIVLLGYATLVRANAAFATVPLGVLALSGAPLRAGRAVVVAIAAIIAVLAIEPVINHDLLAAAPSGVEHTEALFDLAGIAGRSSSAAGTGLTTAERRQILARHCARPFFWDPLGAPGHCDTTMARLDSLPTGRLYRTLATAIVHHPLAYAGHRLAHLNSTERWLVPARWPAAAPPDQSEPNTLGLATPGRAAARWQSVAGALADTPLGWPFAWVIVALTTAAALRSAPPSPARQLALALAGSALAMEASFVVLSIASDLRYHLWSILAAALALVLAGGAAPLDRRAVAIGGGVLALACLAAIAARAMLPLPPVGYEAMLG